MWCKNVQVEKGRLRFDSVDVKHGGRDGEVTADARDQERRWIVRSLELLSDYSSRSVPGAVPAGRCSTLGAAGHTRQKTHTERLAEFAAAGLV